MEKIKSRRKVGLNCIQGSIFTNLSCQAKICFRLPCGKNVADITSSVSKKAGKKYTTNSVSAIAHRYSLLHTIMMVF